MRGTEAAVRDIMQYNTLVNRAHNDSDYSMVYHGLKAKRLEDPVVLAWGESCLMNVKDEGQEHN